ncbi:hypothetical protein CCUS01_02316 [Colletotrichum cuscutae]|uniref:Uncharacterized protein n=1 Tax=Colletotrichum cuscutae TaxID=1209917 RepID=A0AAI9TVK5_9PEZI|nr:hypothetical protein CCUS01_02316 [Colletotrichum cuscutae]
MLGNAIVYDDEDFVETLLRDVAIILMTECHADVEDEHIKLATQGSTHDWKAMIVTLSLVHLHGSKANSHGIVRELASMKEFILPSRLLGCGINHNGEIDCDRQVSNVQTPLWTASSRGPLREGVHDVDGPSARSPSRLWINVQPRRFVAAEVAASSPAHVSVEKLHNGLRADGARIGDGASNQSGRRMLHGGFST